MGWVAPVAAGTFNITLNFGDGLTGGEELLFAKAANYWESVITGYQPGLSADGLTISASAPYIDGVGGVLGSTSINSYSDQVDATDREYYLSQAATINFDSADLASMYSNGSLYYVILHEMAHAIGFGTFWNANGDYFPSHNNRYIGAAALAAYRTEFVGQSNATYVPVETDGGDGVAFCHWAEVDGGSASTGIVTTSGRDMQYELMTPWLNYSSTNLPFVSRTTMASFVDMGYTIAGFGDANGDGVVNGADLGVVLANFNQTGKDWTMGDFNGDGTVNGADLGVVLANFNSSSSMTAAAAEPSALGLSAVGTALALGGWTIRRKRTP